ncbi:hypothetical protein LBMAG48_10540 [Phycisphaerae bacterium]|nr:hypothetical protein LBMAG48_10540 [Phycisphaerae bacterium]
MSAKSITKSERRSADPLPEWTESPLRDLLDELETGTRPRGGVRGIRSGIPSVGAEHLTDRGGFNFESVKYVPEAFYADMRRGHLRPGDVLIVKDGATSGKVCLVREDFPFAKAVINEHVFRCCPRRDIDSQYLFWFLWSKQGQSRILENFQGSAQGGINQRFASNTLVPIVPLPDQRRIVRVIEQLAARVDAARARLAAVPTILKRFRQAVLAAACSGRLTEDWRNNNPEIEPARTGLNQFDHSRKQPKGKTTKPKAGELDVESMPDLPETWVYRRADTVVAADTIITYGIVLPGPEVPGGVPYVRQQDIQDGGILVGQLRRTTHDIAAKHGRSVLAEGDVLLCIIRHLRVATVPRGLDGANLTQGTVRMRPSEVISGPYLARFLASEHAQAWMKQRHFGMSMPRINVEHARAIPVAVPPMAEQTEIVRRVDSLMKLADAIERRVALAQARADKLTQSILAKAFRGELVPAIEAKPEAVADLARAKSVVWRFEDFAAVQAEIVRRFPKDPTLGRKKLFKLTYLAAALCNAKTEKPLKRDAAGPYDGKLQADTESHAASQRWFTANKAARDPGDAHYRPGTQGTQASAACKALVGDQWARFEALLTASKSWDSKAAELHATTHAAWNSLVAEGVEATPDAIVRRFFEWSNEKAKKFSKWQVESAREALVKHGLVPIGRSLVVDGLGEPELFTASNT